MTTRRALTIWLGSFLLITVVLVMFARAPLTPLLVAGAITLVVTIVRSKRPG